MKSVHRFTAAAFLIHVACALWAPLLLQADGRANQDSQQQTKSPMTVEITLLAAMQQNEGKWAFSNELSVHVCEGVRIRELWTRVKKTKSHVYVDVKAVTFTEPGHDKKVSLNLELYVGSEYLGASEIKNLDAEETDEVSGRTTILVPRVVWPTDQLPRLRVTMYVIDD